jgi:hypothetical protein
MIAEKKRLEEDLKKKKHWRRWGPYLSERQWATVREDYSEDGEVWSSFPHEQARMRAYRWGEDGIAGISDNHQRLCFALAFWNGEDPILKERLFGLTNKEGNHGEDVKEYYFYVDNTPLHTYMHYLYKYPQGAFPYAKLVEENQKRGLKEPEYELLDTGIFEKDRYFDIAIEYAKDTSEDLFISITATNRGDETKSLHVLPTLWFRNTWSWEVEAKKNKPHLSAKANCLEAFEDSLGSYFLYFEGKPETLFTENETNIEKLLGRHNVTAHVKDAFHEYVIKKNASAINPHQVGTKSALHYILEVPAHEARQIRLRLCQTPKLNDPFKKFEKIFRQRKEEADEFYENLIPAHASEELRTIQRKAFAGMLWNKQFYHYVVEDWLKVDPLLQAPINRKVKRNQDWPHLYNDDILSVPDKWEYPCFFSWDMAFHTLAFSMIDPEFAKRQLTLLTREWYMHPNGQVPAYEWSFDDVNPPVHAWAAWRVYKISQRKHDKEDQFFLERVFQKLLLNFTWWVNRKDIEGRNIFQGGFLGMDNISAFNRSDLLPGSGILLEADATSWMGMYCVNMLTIALELSKEAPSYEDMASKFFEHFLSIADAINYKQGDRLSLWDQKDHFFYDLLVFPDGRREVLQTRSMVGIVPLFAVTTLSDEDLKNFPGFRKRMEWFLENRTDLCDKIASLRTPGREGRRLLSLVDGTNLRGILEKVLDENEFLSPYGIRSLSKYHEKHPYVLKLDGQEHQVEYEPAESTSKLFGGNSNWRGPIWFPLNMLIIESLQKFHYYYGDDYKVECPTGSGKMMTLWEVSSEIAHRLVRMFLKDSQGLRPIYGGNSTFQRDPHWKDHLLFYEYFHGENGAGIGASHQTGWTGLIAKLIQQLSEYERTKIHGSR